MKTTVKREKSTSTKGHYVRNADLLPAIIEAKQLGYVTDRLIKMIRMIAVNYSRKGKFVRYSYREDMISAAVENLCKNALKFNEQKYSNPFAYYTTAINNSFLQFLTDEKKHRNLRDKLLIDQGANPSFNFMQQEQDEIHYSIPESDEHYVPESDDEPAVKESDDDEEVIAPKEERIRFAGRAPGQLRKYGPGDIDVDPVTGAITIKPEAIARYEQPAQPAETKKSPRKRAVKEKVMAVKEKQAPKKAVKEKQAPKKVVKENQAPKKVVKENQPAKKKITTAPKPKAPAKSKGATIPEKKLTPLARAKKKAEELTKPAAKKEVAKKTTKKAK